MRALEYFGAALYHAKRRELDFAIFFAELSNYPQASELAEICRAQRELCRDFKIKACEYGKRKWYRRAARNFAAALEINVQDEIARRGLICTAGRGFIL